MRPLAAQVRAETWMTLRRGETLLLTIGIPVVFLVFFSTVHVLPTGTTEPVSFLVPGILSLAIMSTAMVSLGIATGFERGYGVLKRLGATPLGRPRLLGAKLSTVLLVEVVQAAVLVAVTLLFAPVAGMGLLYTLTAAVLGAVYIAMAARLWDRARRDQASGADAMRLFTYSITYLTLLFVVMAVDVLVRYR